MTTTLALLAVASLLFSSSNAFKFGQTRNAATSSTRRSVIPDASLLTSLLQTTAPDQAKAEFFFFFFGGSGALGIGGKQVPKLFNEWKKIQELAGGTTLGGADLSINPIATLQYPEALREADILQIIADMPDMNDVYDAGPKKNWIAKQGYLEREALAVVLPNSNPLALYAVFDAMSKGGGEMANPRDAQEMVNTWKGSGGIDAFKGDLTSANAKKFSAYAVFFGLIALVVDLVVESGIDAWL